MVNTRREQTAAGRRRTGQGFDKGNRIARTGAGQGAAGEIGRRGEVIAGDDRGSTGFLYGQQRRQWHHLAGGVPHLEPTDILRQHAERGVCLGRHLPVAAEGGEVVDVGTAEIDLEGLVDRCNRDASRLRFGAVDVDEQLWLVGPKRGKQPYESWLGSQVAGKFRRRLLQRRRTMAGAVADLQLEAAGVPQAVDRRGVEDNALGVTNRGEGLP